MLIGAFAAAVSNLFTGTHAEPSPREEENDRDGAKSWKRFLWATTKYFAAFAALMAVGGLLLAASGIIPIKASSRHWAITKWFLNFSSQRSVSTHTIGMDVPPLDDAALVLKGAGTYESNCRGCHGSPSIHSPRVTHHMTPQPPYLPTVLHEWDDAELFYIVKHGIKFAGMPAWPTQQRDDEVWAMVAFIRLLPGINVDEYRRLTGTNAELNGYAVPLERRVAPTNVPVAITTSCARCHGFDGLGRGTGAFPKIAAQSSVYLYHSLLAYERSDRHSGVMGPVAAVLSKDEMIELANYYASLRPPKITSFPAVADVEAVERGRQIALEGVPGQRIPSCIACHGPSTLPRNPAFPRLAGQYSDFLSQQLRLFRQDRRGGSDYGDIMRRIAVRLSDRQASDLALYYSSLPPGEHEK